MRSKINTSTKETYYNIFLRSNQSNQSICKFILLFAFEESRGGVGRYVFYHCHTFLEKKAMYPNNFCL